MTCNASNTSKYTMEEITEDHAMWKLQMSAISWFCGNCAVDISFLLPTQMLRHKHNYIKIKLSDKPRNENVRSLFANAKASRKYFFDRIYFMNY